MILPTIKEGAVGYNWGFLVDVQFELLSIPPVPYVVDFNQYNYLQTSEDAGYQYLIPALSNGLIPTKFIDTGINIPNKWIFGDFYVPEDGVYEFRIRIKLAIRYGNIAFNPIFGFFFINPESDNDLVEGRTKYFDNGIQQRWKYDLFDSFLFVDLQGTRNIWKFLLTLLFLLMSTVILLI